MAPYNYPPNAVWFITGCSSGIGQALCAHLATKTTSRIVATARNPSTLTSLPDGPNILKLPLDVTSEDSIQAAVKATLDKFKRIDVLVNNAGFGLLSDAETTSLSVAHNLMETNFWGAVRLTQLTLPIFRDSNPTSGPKGGLVIQVSSMGGRVAFQGSTFYHASKYALEGFTEGLAKEVHPDWNIHFLIAEPGGVKTAFVDSQAKKLMKDEERHVAYLDEGMPINSLIKYLESGEAMKFFSGAERVAEVLVGMVEKGGEMGLRMPLGADAWGFLMDGAKKDLENLEMGEMIAKSVSESGEEQFRSLGFLKK